jgi:hypothetical protein
VLGAFQVNIPVQTKSLLLPREERLLSVMRWIGEAIPADSRWYPVFNRYLDQLSDRVAGFGGNQRRQQREPGRNESVPRFRDHRPTHEAEAKLQARDSVSKRRNGVQSVNAIPLHYNG